MGTYLDGSGESFHFDANGNMLNFFSRKGDGINRSYDALNRMSRKTSPVSDVSYSYDLAGWTKSMTDNIGLAIPNVTSPVRPGVVYTANYSYDALNRLCAVN